MSAEPMYIVVDSGRPVTAFTDKDDLKAYLKRMRGTFNQQGCVEQVGVVQVGSAQVGIAPG